jgi:RNA recognition motif-containing protein
MPVDRETGRPRGFAFVEFADRAVAEDVIKKFDAQPFMGRNLAVSEARAREDRPPGPRPGGFGGPPRPGGFSGPRPGGFGGGGGFSGPRPGGFGGGGGGFSPRPGGPGGGPSGPGGRDRSANFGPPAPPKRLRGKKGQQGEHKPKGPIKEKTSGRTYALDDLEDDNLEVEDVATSAAPDADADVDVDVDVNAKVHDDKDEE